MSWWLLIKHVAAVVRPEVGQLTQETLTSLTLQEKSVHFKGHKV